MIAISLYILMLELAEALERACDDSELPWQFRAAEFSWVAQS
jgi:hypothetical protein